MERQAYPDTDERRSWHYPAPWDGVVWLPVRTPWLNRARRLRDIALFSIRALTTAMIAGAVLTVVVGVAASAGA